MNLVVVKNTKRHGELIADLYGEAASLRKGDVMGMAGKLFADEARLACDEGQMDLVPDAPFAGDGQHRFVDGAPRRNP